MSTISNFTWFTIIWYGNMLVYMEKKEEFNGTSTHLLDGYISANQRFFSTFLSKITKYNRVPLGFDPSVARLLGHDPTPRPI